MGPAEPQRGSGPCHAEGGPRPRAKRAAPNPPLSATNPRSLDLGFFIGEYELRKRDKTSLAPRERLLDTIAERSSKF